MSEAIAASIEPISDADWAQTPNSVRHSLLERIKQLERQYEALKAENTMLREQFESNSQSSSKPPP
jgi:transposase